MKEATHLNRQHPFKMKTFHFDMKNFLDKKTLTDEKIFHGMRMSLSRAEEEALKKSDYKFMTKEEKRKMTLIFSEWRKRFLLKQREKYLEKRIWEEEHWIEGEGGNGWFH